MNKIAKNKIRTLSSWKKELDSVFSKYIRARDKHICYTCNLKMEPNRSQNGHFVPRQYLKTRWDEVNCHAQCYACNLLYNGQPSAYAIRLRKDYGDGVVELLESNRGIPVKLDHIWYKDQIDIYTKKLQELENVGY